MAVYRRAADERLNALAAAEQERHRLLEVAEQRLKLILRLNEQLSPFGLSWPQRVLHWAYLTCRNIRAG
jgi:hypothetical protein